jgi:RNA polymerase sigma-70 factor (ECF subfamily)
MVLEIKDTNWFKKTFDDHYDFIRNYLYYLSGDMDLSEDIAQDVFLKIWEKRETIKDETLKPLLFRIARNLYFNTHKRKGVDLKFVKATEYDDEHESPEYLLEVKEFDERLQRAIANLPEHCRTIFLMSRMDEMKYHEIAERFSISIKAVEKQISKALRLLREEIDYRV